MFLQFTAAALLHLQWQNSSIHNAGAMVNLFLSLAAISGFLAVAIGAFGAHGLENLLSPESMRTYQTGVQYHFYHSLALFGVALLLLQTGPERLLSSAGWGFVIGIILLPGSLYLLSITGIRWLGAITPIGGVAFLVGWGCLLWFAISNRLTVA